MRSSERSSRASRFLPALILAALLAPRGPSPEARATLLERPAGPCRIVYPDTLSREADEAASALPDIVERLSRRLGAPAPPQCRLYLATRAELSDDEVGSATAAMPEWAAGIALPDIGTIVIRADRIGPWRQRSLAGVLAHEVAHLVMSAAAGEGADRMPAWFREGVASNLARDGEWLDFFYLWVSPIPSSDRPLAEIGASLNAGGQPVLVKAAYAGAFSFVRSVMARHSADLPARVLDGLRRGHDFESAWEAAAGASLARDELAWSESVRYRTRWAAILTSSATLWLAITLLVLLAWLFKKRRAARVMDRWGEEDPY